MMSGTLGLSVSDVVNVTISLTPAGGAPRNFGATMAIDGSGVIDVVQRLRAYTSLRRRLSRRFCMAQSSAQPSSFSVISPALPPVQ
jgi:hypothetical protein